MRAKEAFSAGTPTFVIFIALLLASAMVPTLAQARNFKVLHTFHGRDGGSPTGVLVRDAAGNIYGTTIGGGTGKCSKFGCGTAFKLNKAGKQVWLHSFEGGNGWNPVAGLVRDASGNLYGATTFGGKITKVCGGTQVGGCGIVFKLDKTGKETVLYKFKGTPDGFFPDALLVRDAAGNLYGTTPLGGSGGLGAVFKIDETGKETVLYSFTGGSDGCDPSHGVILDSAGNLYGVTMDGGAGFCNSGSGVVFKVDTGGKETVLHTFGGSDGANPDSVLLFDSQGDLYGTTANGGNGQCGGTGCGVVFELSPQSGGGWSEAVLYAFCSLSGCGDGEEPLGPLLRDASGNLFGTTYFGGTSGDGVVFKFETTGKETVLHDFTGRADGANPSGGLTLDNSGSLYGVAEAGGATCFARYTCGVVFKITP
jgi:uncharacterized repeat protein (TIGR03803 family)